VEILSLEIGVQIVPLLYDLLPYLAISAKVIIISKLEISRGWITDIDRYFSEYFSISYQSNRIVLTLDAAPHQMDNIFWTIGIISGGNNEERLQNIIESIQQNNIPSIEVIIIGPKPRLLIPTWVKHIEFVEDPKEPRFGITKKKNIVLKKARHNNILLLHDRYLLSADWYKNVLKSVTAWDILCFKQICQPTPEYRLMDWIDYTRSFPKARYNTHHFSRPFCIESFNTRILDYPYYSLNILVNGGAFAVKKHTAERINMSEYLFWSEIEDDDFSIRVNNNGFIIRLTDSAILISVVSKHSGHTLSPTILDRAYEDTMKYIQKTKKSIMKIAFPILSRMNNRKTLFRSRSIFSSIKTLVIDAQEQRMISTTHSSFDTIYVRNIETIQPLKTILEVVQDHLTNDSSIFFELNTLGLGFYSRGYGIRCCEQLCYELSIFFKSTISMVYLINTQQNSYILKYRYHAPADNTNSATRYCIISTSSQSRRNLSVNTAFFTFDEILKKPILGEFDYVILLNHEDLLDEALKCLPLHINHNAYRVGGDASSYLLLQTLIFRTKVFNDCLPIKYCSNIETICSIFENNFIYQGYSVRQKKT
jgi:GT2 family glycosyltransferase